MYIQNAQNETGDSKNTLKHPEKTPPPLDLLPMPQGLESGSERSGVDGALALALIGPRRTAERLSLRRPKLVHICTGVSANFDKVIRLIYLPFAEGKFKQSGFWSNYPQKCIFFGPKKDTVVWANYPFFSGSSPKSGVLWVRYPTFFAFLPQNVLS